jgi:SAM-dependent methyltransferase
LARNPKLDIKFGDGEFLDDYPSYSFNGVMMECVLSLINLPDEALHEVYCVLKKGGKLFISDLYIKNPKPEFLQALAREAEIQQQTPHSEGDCSSHNHSDCDEQDCNTCDAGNMSSCDDNCSDCSDCSLDCDHSHDHDHSHDDHDMGPDSDYYKKEHKKKAVPFRSEGRLAIDPLIEELKEIGFQNIQWEDFSIELDNFVAEKMMSGESLEECFFCESLKPEDGYKTGYFLLVAEKPL